VLVAHSRLAPPADALFALECEESGISCDPEPGAATSGENKAPSPRKREELPSPEEEDFECAELPAAEGALTACEAATMPSWIDKLERIERRKPTLLRTLAGCLCGEPLGDCLGLRCGVRASSSRSRPSFSSRSVGVASWLPPAAASASLSWLFSALPRPGRREPPSAPVCAESASEPPVGETGPRFDGAEEESTSTDMRDCRRSLILRLSNPVSNDREPP